MKSLFPKFLLLASMLAGCTVGPRYEPPEIEVPCTWHSELSKSMYEQPSEQIIWWESLQDPLLNELMDLASIQNLDLFIAATRVLQARSEIKAKSGSLLPHLDGSANCGHVYYSKDALVNGLLGTTSHGKSRHHVRRNVNFFELGFDVEWEIDFFGMTAHEISALKAQEEAVQDELCGIWVTLSAEIARNYIELRGFQQSLKNIQRRVQVQEYAIQLTQELQGRGILNDGDVSREQAEWNTLKAEEPLVELSIARAIHRLSILIGCAPGDLFECFEIAELPQLPTEQLIGIPSDLLRRRPDITKAERELAAATERVASAIAGLFPRFSLNGFLGDISTHVGSLFKPASATWFAGPQLMVPIFNSRLLMQDVEYNKIATKQAIYNYQKKVLEALEETENAIASYHHQEERSGFLENAYHQNEEAYKFAEELYHRGLTDYFAVNTSAKAYFVSEEMYRQSQVDLLLSYVSLHKALGGSIKEQGL